jgi:hypothetical protein
MIARAAGSDARSDMERADAQRGVRDDAGAPGGWTLLWALLGGPVVWGIHLLVTYVLLAYACTTGWTAGPRGVLAVISAVAVALTAWSGWVAWRWWHVARDTDRPEDDAWDARMGERTARVSFLMVVGLFSALIFGIGIVYEAITIWFVPLCDPGVSA